jgi:Type II intron maturase
MKLFKGIAVVTTLCKNIFSNLRSGPPYDKNCHIVLELLQMKFGECSWIIKGYIPPCFSIINHGILLKILREKNHYHKDIDFIKKILKRFSRSGISIIDSEQGCSLNHLFWDIYSNKLDSFMFVLKGLYEQKQFKDGGFESYAKFFTSRTVSLPSENRKLTEDLLLRSLSYVRYKDGFLVGIMGFQDDTVLVKVIIENFLRDYLLLPLDMFEIKVFKFNKKGISFLGTDIKKVLKRKKITKINWRSGRMAKIYTHTFLKAPIATLLKKASESGFFRRIEGGIFTPIVHRFIVNKNHSEILFFYNSKIRRILNYYSFVDNQKSLMAFIQGLKYSCALTLALKFQLRFRSKIFKKFGDYLMCEQTGTKLLV